MKLNHSHALAASFAAAALAVALLHAGARAQETATDSTSAASAATLPAVPDAMSGRSIPPPPYLVGGNPGCYRLAGDCIDLQCATGGSAWHYNPSPCPPNHICAGGMAFQKGLTASTYGPWYTIVPKGATGTYQRLKVRFNSNFTAGQKLADYNPVTKTWTLFAPPNTYQAQVVYNHTIWCW